MPQTDSNLKLIIYSIKLNGEREWFTNANSVNEVITRFNEEQGRDLYICDKDDEHRKGELRKIAKEIKKVKMKEQKREFYVGERDSS